MQTPVGWNCLVVDEFPLSRYQESNERDKRQNHYGALLKIPYIFRTNYAFKVDVAN